MSKISGNILNICIRRKWIICEDEDYYEAYTYKINNWLTKLIFIVITTSVALAYQQFINMVCFIIGFIAFRRVAGGVHFSSAKLCMIFSILICFGAGSVFKFTTQPMDAILILSSVVVSLINAIAFAPRVHSFDPKTRIELAKMRKISLCLVTANLLLTAVVIFNQVMRPYFFAYCFGVGIASMTLLFAWLEDKFISRKEYQS